MIRDTLRNFLERRKKTKYEKVLSNIETNKSIKNIKKIIKILYIEKDTPYYQKALLSLKKCNKETDEAIKYILMLIQKECIKEIKLMDKISAHSNHSYSCSIRSNVDRRPFDLLLEVGDSKVIPLLEDMLEKIPESVTYTTWWDAKHDMIEIYTPLARELILRIIQTLKSAGAEGK